MCQPGEKIGGETETEERDKWEGGREGGTDRQERGKRKEREEGEVRRGECG